MRFLGRPPAGATASSCPGRAAAVLLVSGVLAIHGAVLGAQAPTASPNSAPAARPDGGRGAALTARYHVRQMENVLERAVQHAADMMRRRLAAFTPDVLALAGAPRAQGFRIDGYGLFFSVEVPRLSESVNWALRVLSQDRDERVLASLQKVAAAEQDPAVRADLERAIRTMQLQMTVMPSRAPGTQASPQRRASVPVPPAPYSSAATAPPASSDRVTATAESGPAADAPKPATTVDASSLPALATAPSPPPPPETPAADPPRDPSAVYEDEVKGALVDALLDYAGSLPLPPTEWVTVAARDAGYVAFPDAVSDMVTVTLSVRVSELVDFRAQRLTREEARTRVLVREF